MESEQERIEGHGISREGNPAARPGRRENDSTGGVGGLGRHLAEEIISDHGLLPFTKWKTISSGGTPVGEEVNLTLSGREIVCLLGPNRGGKTTLFRTFLGILPPITGEVRAADRIALLEAGRIVAQRPPRGTATPERLARLDVKARRRVCLTSLVGGRSIRADVLELLGRERPSYPDYIYILNLLHRMRRHPRLDTIRAGRRSDESPGLEHVVKRVEFSLGSLSPDERQRLEARYREGPERADRGREPYRWAFVSWETIPGRSSP